MISGKISSWVIMASGLTIQDVLNGVLGDSDDESGNEFSDDELEYGEDVEET